MAESIIFFFVILIIFLILSETITFKFKYERYLVTEIGMTLFAIVFTPSDKDRVRSKKRRKRRGTRSVMRAFILSLLHKSNVDIQRLYISRTADTPMEYALSYAAANAALGTAFSYISANCKNFTYSNIFFSQSDNNTFEVVFDLRITISLLAFTASFVKFAFNYTKDCIKEKILKCRKTK